MSMRRASLDEWFTAYQLRSLNKDYFYNPGYLDVDITAIVERYRERGQRLSYPALVMKAYALTAREVPEINRAYLRTPLGDRVVEFDDISVNMPVALRENGQSYLSAMVVKEADTLSVADISEQIRAAQARSMDDTRLTKIVARRPNSLLWRSVLRSMHYAAYRWPALMAREAGGLSVSSIMEHRLAPAAHFRAVSFGPTATTILLTGVRETADHRQILELGMGLNHVALTGVAWKRMGTVLSDLLESRSSDTLASFD